MIELAYLIVFTIALVLLYAFIFTANVLNEEIEQSEPDDPLCDIPWGDVPYVPMRDYDEVSNQ